MELELDETQLLFRDTIRQYLDTEVPFSRIRELEAEGAADEKLWQTLSEQGWLGISFPDARGGGGGGLLEAGLLVEELSRRAALVPVVESIACGIALQRAGEGAEAAAAVRALVAGEATLTPAVLEASDRFGDVHAEVGSDGTLRGEKYFVDYATQATHHLVVANSAVGIGLFQVARDDSAVSCDRLFSLGRIPQARVRYDGASATRVAGEAGVELLVNVARALTSVQIMASMQQALDQAVAYTNLREQFGRPLSTFQAVQHHAANMAMSVESARFLCYEVLDSLERGEASTADVAIVKASVSRRVAEVTMLSHQLHGGHGFIEDNDLYFFTLRGKDRSLAWGTVEECLEIIATEVEEPVRWL